MQCCTIHHGPNPGEHLNILAKCTSSLLNIKRTIHRLKPASLMSAGILPLNLIEARSDSKCFSGLGPESQHHFESSETAHICPQSMYVIL